MYNLTTTHRSASLYLNPTAGEGIDFKDNSRREGVQVTYFFGKTLQWDMDRGTHCDGLRSTYTLLTCTPSLLLLSLISIPSLPTPCKSTTQQAVNFVSDSYTWYSARTDAQLQPLQP